MYELSLSRSMLARSPSTQGGGSTGQYTLIVPRGPHILSARIYQVEHIATQCSNGDLIDYLYGANRCESASDSFRTSFVLCIVFCGRFFTVSVVSTYKSECFVWLSS